MSKKQKFKKSLGALLVETGLKVAKIRDHLLKKEGLSDVSGGRILVLSILKEGKATQAELCRQTGQKPPSMMEMLQRLNKEQFIFGTTDPDNKRRVHWALTSQGKKQAKRITKVLKFFAKEADRLIQKKGYSLKDIEWVKEFLHHLLSIKTLDP